MSECHYSEVNKYIEWSWINFHPREFACKCCGNVLFNKGTADAWDKIQAFRDVAGVPVIINSAHRCKKHNKAVGGAPNSYHLKGVAFDIRITDKLPRHVIHDAAKRVGFTGFGDYNTFVHVDTGRARNWKG